MRDSRTSQDRPSTAEPGGVLRPFRPGGPRQRLVCRLTTLRFQPGLSRAAIQFLSEEMPEIEFCLGDRDDVDVIWLVGYEEGSERVVRDLRSAHPTSKILVTKRGPAERWGPPVLAAGADFACAWPIPGHRLSELLHGRRVRQIV